MRRSRRFQLNREGPLELMYRGDATRTVPNMVASMLGVPAERAWFEEGTVAAQRP